MEIIIKPGPNEKATLVIETQERQKVDINEVAEALHSVVSKTLDRTENRSLSV